MRLSSQVRTSTPSKDAPSTRGDRLCRVISVARTSLGASSSISGSNPERVFVLVPGIGMSHRYFLPLAATLAEHGTVHLIEFPGPGWTGPSLASLTPMDSATMIGDLLDQLDVSSCTVIGHSLGAQAATELAVRRPDLVTDVVLIGPAVDTRNQTIPKQGIRLAVNSALESPSLKLLQFADCLRCGPRWYAGQLRTSMTYHLDQWLPHVTQSVLIIRGRRDLVAGHLWCQTLATTARQGVLVDIPKQSHCIHHSAPTTITTEIIEWSLTVTPA